MLGGDFVSFTFGFFCYICDVVYPILNFQGVVIMRGWMDIWNILDILGLLLNVVVREGGEG